MRKIIGHMKPKNRKGSIFAENEIAAYDTRARSLNEQGRGDQTIFYLKNQK
jgi:hypothetical protein